MTEFLLLIKVFIFIFCCLNVIKNVFTFAKVLWTQQGKYDSSTTSQICLGMSLSYILTLIIIGF